MWSQGLLRPQSQIRYVSVISTGITRMQAVKSTAFLCTQRSNNDSIRAEPVKQICEIRDESRVNRRVIRAVDNSGPHCRYLCVGVVKIRATPVLELSRARPRALRLALQTNSVRLEIEP
ncbi:hypothetical protein J6590_003469 [Homalodisca vitripennis]|nr:hypothetical protein J6590_003469 [Homalodisca vitripennis]